jgi:hypothetical protein
VSLDEQTANAKQNWVDADPIRKPRSRPYSLADWALTKADLAPIFARYAETYGVELER